MKQACVGRRVVCVVAAAALIAVGLPATGVAASGRESGAVRLLGELTVPNGLQVGGTTVGGLSGIDRDPSTGHYVLISDDRSEHGPARFYTARIDVDAQGLHGFRFTGTHPLRRPDGHTYPPLPQWQTGDQLGPVNPEGVRVDPWTDAITWSQEGIDDPPTVLNPSIRQASRTGGYLGQLPLPANEHFTGVPNTGPRGNQTLESITYAASGTLIASALEGPLGQDGPPPTPQQGALTRITLQTRTGAVLAQYAYPLDPLFTTPTGPPGQVGGLVGVSDMLAGDPADPTRYLMLQRSYATGHGYDVRIYEIDTTGATDIKDVPALAGHPVTPVGKTLLADLDSLGLPDIHNIEGIAWGPTLPTGERTLLLVSDNNFSPSETARLIAIALPR